MNKILLVLQFSPGDRDVAFELTKLIVDLEDGICPYADLMFSASYGTRHDHEIIAIAKRKFATVYTHTCLENVTGWPAGPNSQVREVVADVFVGHRDRGWNYSAFMLMEPDFVPLSKDWIKQLYDEWMEKPTGVLGAWMSSGMFWCYSEHINGNCLISPDFVKKHKFFRTHSIGSWDTYQSTTMLPEARASRLIFNDYRINSQHNPLPAGVTLEDYLFSDKKYPDNHPLSGKVIRPCYYHGSKGFEAINIVRKRLLK